jgi:hypothetical protein
LAAGEKANGNAKAAGDDEAKRHWVMGGDFGRVLAAAKKLLIAMKLPKYVKAQQNVYNTQNNSQPDHFLSIYFIVA